MASRSIGIGRALTFQMRSFLQSLVRLMLSRKMGNKTFCWSQGTARRGMTQVSTARHSQGNIGPAEHAQHSTAQHSTAQHSTAQHSTAQHSTAQHSTAQPTNAGSGTLQQSTLTSTQHSTDAQTFWPGIQTIGHLQGLAPFIGRVVCCKQRSVGGHVRLEPGSFHLLKDVPCLLPLLT